MVQEGDSESVWDFIEGDEGEGYRVLAGYESETSLMAYFETNQLSEVGYIVEHHGDEGSYPGDDHNGTDYGNNDGNVTGPDHGDGGEDYGNNDGNGTEGEGIPVFYLSANDIEVLSGADGAEGYYGIYKDSSWDETTNAHVFEYWLEPAKMVQEGDSESGWDFIEGDEGEGYRVLAGYESETSLMAYFETNQLSEVGYIVEHHGDEGSYPGDDHNGTDYGK